MMGSEVYMKAYLNIGLIFNYESMKPKVSFAIPENLEERLEEVTDETGLTKSEIGRRGLLEQVQELGDAGE